MAMIMAGVSFRTASVEIRERLVVSGNDTAAFLRPLVDGGSVSEAVVLSTCNRTEVYALETRDGATADIWRLMNERLGEDVSSLGYMRSGREAAAHLFRVTSGLDSMILGEAQIHGQVRDAWQHSRESSGVALNRLFQTALQVGGRVRHETGVARGAASVSSAAVQLARQIFGSLRGRRAMVLGAGEMAELALECLVSEGVRAAIVANRSFDRAELLAREFGARAMHFDECWKELAAVDVLICSTAAPHALVTEARIRDSLSRRGSGPLCILDIALPRDVEPAVGALENVFLYDIDDLSAVASENIERRKGEVPSAELVIEEEVDRYWRWLGGLAAVPVLTSVRANMDEMREKELQSVLKRLQHLDAADREQLELFSRALMNKFLHNPSVRLREAASNGRGLSVIDVAQYLFAVEESAPDQANGVAELEHTADEEGRLD